MNNMRGIGFFFALAAAIALTACGGDGKSGSNNGNNNGGGNNSGPGNNGNSGAAAIAYWSDAYNQNALYGNVKTVQEWREYSDSYQKTVFDKNGNMIEDRGYSGRHTSSEADDQIRSGSVLNYDSQHRLTKVEYYSDGKLSETVEFTYGGANSHNVYLPAYLRLTNVLRALLLPAQYRFNGSLERFLLNGADTDYVNADRSLEFGQGFLLQAGVTGVGFRRYNNGTAVQDQGGALKCVSAKENELIFDVLDSGNTPIGKIFITPQKRYPARIVFENTYGRMRRLVDATIEFDGDGVPTKITDVSSGSWGEFGVKNDFLVGTRGSNFSGSSYAYAYNDHGHVMSRKRSGVEDSRYTYEYDDNGNWIRQTEKYRIDQNNWGEIVTIREYTYW